MSRVAPPRKKLSETVRDDSPMSLWPAEMCKRVLESSPWPMFVLDCETGRVLEVNDAAIRVYGFSRDIFLDRGVEKVVPAELRPRLLATLAQGMNGPVSDYESEHQLADGRRIPVSITSYPLHWNGRPARFSMVRNSRLSPVASTGSRPPADASFRPLPDPLPVQSPEPLLRSQPEPSLRPEAALSLGSTATHDFNNLLTVILGVAEQMQEGHGDPGQQAELIARTVRNAQELAHQRLLLGYQQQSRREQLNLNEAIREQADVLAAVLGDQIKLEMDLDRDLWPIVADGHQWNELMLNLAMNARDAMPSGGEFHIFTRRVLFAGDADLPPGRHVHLSVRDNGMGMAPETRLHAFEPYFSTKSRAKNSGLGLASVHGVVRQSGGVIRLTSEPGLGARFDIFIPAQDIAAADDAGGLVLVVEDADELRRLIQDFLIARGYEVISCGSGEAAMQSARSVDRPIDLVISDMLLPDITGVILAEQVRLQHPEASVIFMSGYEFPLLHGPAAEYAACLQKPFSLHQLATSVARLLRARSGGSRP